MNIQETSDKKISKLSDEITMASDNIASNKINKADYDKTLIGYVSEKIIPENPKDAYDYKWRIQTNGTAYDIKPSACNITSVGQRVRLYVPNHSLKDKYAEVIDDGGYNHPTKVVFNDDDNTITETYNVLNEFATNKAFHFFIIICSVGQIHRRRLKRKFLLMFPTTIVIIISLTIIYVK